jgi:hypothetical protein
MIGSIFSPTEHFASPFVRYAMSLMEAFPVGLLITLIASVILKRKSYG